MKTDRPLEAVRGRGGRHRVVTGIGQKADNLLGEVIGFVRCSVTKHTVSYFI